MSLLRLASATKLYWGLAVLFLFGLFSSPVTSSGKNIFLSFGNLTDIFRQVSITGLVAVGMTAIILIGGIDLSVGTMMAFSTVMVAMLLTQEGWSTAAIIGVPTVFLVTSVASGAGLRFLFAGLARGQQPIGQRADVRLDPLRGKILPVGFGLLVGAIMAYLATTAPGKAGVLQVALIVAATGVLVGTISGSIIVKGRLQPFIVTLAFMVSLLGLARLTAGQDSAVLPVYAGSNATQDIDLVRQMLWGILPLPGLVFLGAAFLMTVLLRFTAYGRYVYAIGGNEEAARLSGIPVARVKIATYALSGMFAMLAGLLYVAQYRQGKPDAGSGLELDVIAAVVIGGTSLMGGRGTISGTIVGVLIFGLLSNLLQLHNINSNLQLVLKGVIIVVTVLLQERNLADLAFWRMLIAPAQARSPGSVVTDDDTTVAAREAALKGGKK